MNELKVMKPICMTDLEYRNRFFFFFAIPSSIKFKCFKQKKYINKELVL